jgi:hypothetical protein
LWQARRDLFFGAGLDRWNHVDPAGEFFLQAHAEKNGVGALIPQRRTLRMNNEDILGMLDRSAAKTLKRLTA